MFIDCCGQPSHWIRDEKNLEVDMVKYVDTFSDHIFRATKMFDRMTYVNYRTYLGKPFLAAMITDNVHWSKTTRKEIANYMMMWLNNKAASNPKNNEVDIEPFSSALLNSDIYVKPVPIEKPIFSDSESEEEEEENDGEGGSDGGEKEEDEDASNPMFPDPNAPNSANNASHSNPAAEDLAGGGAAMQQD